METAKHHPSAEFVIRHLPSSTSGNEREGERCAGFKCEEKSGRWNLHKRLQSLLGERLPEGWQAAFDMERVLV